MCVILHQEANVKKKREGEEEKQKKAADERKAKRILNKILEANAKQLAKTVHYANKAEDDPFSWLTYALYVELPAVPTDQLTPPERSPKDAMGIPMGELPEIFQKLYTLIATYEAACLEYKSHAKNPAKQQHRKANRRLAKRADRIAKALQAVFDFGVDELYDDGDADNVMVAFDWTVRIVRNNDE